MTFLNGRFLGRQATGVDRFALEVLNALSASGLTTMNLRAAVPSRITVAAKLPHGLDVIVGGALAGHAWEQIELPRFARDEPILNLCNAAPLWRENQFVVIHDAGTVSNAVNYTLAFRSWYRAMHTCIMRRSRVVATVSKFSADELTRIYGRRARGLEILTEGCEHVLRHPADTTIIERLDLSHRPFVLALGSASPNKNFKAVAAAAEWLADSGISFVAAGGGDAKVFRSADVSGAKLLRTGYVTDAQLRALYEHAMCFVFPSLYEGFGVPPLEAMLCGCPVIASNRASIPEVCGDAVLYCDPLDSAELAKQIQRLHESQALRAEMSERGLARAALFTWRKAADQFADIVRHNFA